MLAGSYTSAKPASCSDLQVFFARGSGQINPTHSDYELRGGREFKSLRDALNKNLPNGVDYKIEDIPYPAADVGLPGPVNSFNAYFSWSPWGNYQTSVASGVSHIVSRVETANLICGEHTKIALAGYSQGAEVIGNALSQLSAEDRSNIVNVSLFGDPKRHGKDPNVHFYGSASDFTNGVLRARVPYIPEDVARRTYSWCDGSDGICTDTPLFAAGPLSNHGGYSIGATELAAQKIITNFLAVHNLEQQGEVLSDQNIVEQIDFERIEHIKKRKYILVIDRSNSMNELYELLQSADEKSELTTRLNTYFVSAEFAVISYANQAEGQYPRVEQDFTANHEATVSTLADINAEALPIEDQRHSDKMNYSESEISALVHAMQLADESDYAQLVLVSDAHPSDRELIDDTYIAWNDLQDMFFDKNITLHSVSQAHVSGLPAFRNKTKLFGGFSTGFLGDGLADAVSSFGMYVDESPLTSFATKTVFVEPNEPVTLLPTSGPGHYYYRHQKREAPVTSHEWDLDSNGVIDEVTHVSEGGLAQSFPVGFDGYIRVWAKANSRYRWGTDAVRVITKIPDQEDATAPPSFTLSQVGSGRVQVDLDLSGHTEGAWKLYDGAKQIMGIVSSQTPQFFIDDVPSGEEVQLHIGTVSANDHEESRIKSASIVLEEKTEPSTMKDADTTTHSPTISPTTRFSELPLVQSASGVRNSGVLQGSTPSTLTASQASNLQRVSNPQDATDLNELLGAQTQALSPTITELCAEKGCDSTAAQIAVISIIVGGATLFVGYLIFRLK